MQQRIAQKEKEQKEENLRLLAQRAREERSGAAPRIVEKPSAAMGALAGYGSDSEEEEEEERREETMNSEEEKEARERDEVRAERRREREREMRMSNMGTERRARVLARAQNRDISEKIALGLAKPTLSKESMLDSRLFNREQYSNSFGDDDAFNLYDKALFTGSNAGAAIYKPRGNVDEDGEAIGGGGAEGVERAMKIDRFNLGVAGEGKGFEGADANEIKEGPVQFEAADPFGVDKFYDEAAKKGERKRGLESKEEREDAKRKRMREE
ncbi:hypothetical protein BT69DRAFT_1346644 [Atractiella rhizophila]|nr:hypothetical protein BT69DRAFT_1346644 [Atractiella rhizophila]